MINYGDWQNMPDYREGWQNPHESGVARLGRMADPTSYMISAVGGQNAPQVHDVGERVADYSNQVASPVVGATMPIFEALSPEIKQVNKLTGSTGEGLRNFVKNKPVDTAAILAASFFGAGVAGGGASSAGGAASGSSLGAAGDAAATSAITPTLASAGTAAGEGAAASSAHGILGAAGTAALDSSIPSTYGALSASSPSYLGSLLNTFKTYTKPLKTAKRYTDMAQNVNSFAQNQPNERDRMNALSDQLAQRIINDQQTPMQSGVLDNKIRMRRF